MPEHGERSEMKRPRQRIEKLVEVSGDFPEKLPKKIAKIVKRFAPFEDLAIGMGVDSVAALDLNDLMEAEGALNSELVQEIESGGRILRAYSRAKETEILRGTQEIVGNEEYVRLRDDSARRYERVMRRTDANMRTILQRLDDDRRPIATLFTHEMVQYAFLLWLARETDVGGMQKTWTIIEKEKVDLTQKILFDCIIASNIYQTKGDVSVTALPHHEVFDLLRDGAYIETHSEGISIEIHGVEYDGRPVRGTLHTYEPQNPLIIGSVEVNNPKSGLSIVRFMLSRITGELVPDGMNVVSAAEVFALANNSDVYTRIRDAAFAGFLDAVQKGIIGEKTFVSFDQDEGEKIAYRTPPKRTKLAPPVVITEVPPPKELTPQSSSEQITVPIKPAERILPVAEQIAAMNRRGQDKEERIVWMESRITWRRVIAALKRVGVAIDVRGTHPKLQYGSKTTRYLNAHETDPATNKHELYRVLRELDIPRDIFFAQLK